jgi:hypothetical protein
MWRWIFVAGAVSLVPWASWAQSERPIYSSPPESFVIPEEWTVATIESSLGNLSRWRENAHRQVSGEIGRVRGYFMVVRAGSAFDAGAIVRGEWTDSRVAPRPPPLGARLVSGSSACAASRADVDPSDLVYLGPWFDESWIDLGRQINARGVPSRPREVLFDDLHLIVADRDMIERAVPPTYYGSGEARYFCAINVGGVLACTLTSEAPEGEGLGDAGLVMLRFARVESRTPEAIEGQCTRISITFDSAANSARIRAGAPSTE